jgi:hypothetical protein
MDDEPGSSVIASPESSTASNKANLQKKQSIVVRGTVSHIHKVKQSNASISLSMCFFASTVIDSPAVYGLLLIVEAFAMFFDHFFLILFLQREANCKHNNIDNSENETKVHQ